MADLDCATCLGRQKAQLGVRALPQPFPKSARERRTLFAHRDRMLAAAVRRDRRGETWRRRRPCLPEPVSILTGLPMLCSSRAKPR